MSMCDCDCGSECPLGKMGMEGRCSKEKLAQKLTANDLRDCLLRKKNMLSIYNVQKINSSGYPGRILVWFSRKEDAENLAACEGNCKVNEKQIFSTYEEYLRKRKEALGKLLQEEKDLLGL